MENRKFINFIFFIALMAMFLLPFLSFAYDDKTTHPALTGETIDIFNHYYPQLKFTEQEKSVIKQGSVDEDEAPRWVNHFYDPVYNRGWLEHLTSKSWSQNTLAQSGYHQGTLSALSLGYFDYPDDYSWDRAVFEYVHGDKNRALLSLGHILHLIQDSAVPDHTRNDAHPPVLDLGSPYEGWASRFNDANFNLSDELIKNNKAPVIYNSLNQYFDDLAVYSNNNFFSKDTIFAKDYVLPEVLTTKTELLSDGNFYIFGYSKLSKIVLLPEKNIWNINFINNQKATIEDSDDLILSDYWNLLSEKAVLSGAGAIKLFFDDVEKEKQTLALLERNRSFFDKVMSAIIGIFKKPEQKVSSSPTPSLLPTPSSSPLPSFSPSSSPSPVFIPAPSPSIFPLLSPTPTSTPTPAPVESPMPSIIPPPYPGFGGGGSGAPPTPEPVPEITPSPEPSLEPSPEPTPTPTPTPEPAYMDVVINEVAWPGTGNQTSEDEWIELYNRTSRDINLNDWILYSETNEKPWLNLSGTIIPARGYYLIERTDDETVSDIPADWKGSFGNGLNNRGEVLILSHASTTIDQTFLCGAINPYGWPPCYDYKYRTMERINPDIAGIDSSNWGINNGLITNGKTSKGEAVFGTPKARNSANYLIANGSQNISSDITLKKSLSPYIVNNQIQIFQDNAVLNIEPGVVIKFYNDAGLRFSGNSKIIARGTAGEPIVFTSFDDDEYGGDTNNNSTTTYPHPGAWFGAEIETSNSDSIFENSVFRYGGKYYSGWGIFISLGPSNLHIKGTSAQISNSVFEYSRAHGLYLANSDSMASYNIIKNNSGGNPAGYNAGILISGGAPKIQNNTISGNGYGISMANCGAVIDSNVFDSNEREAIVSSGKFGVFTNNSGAGNFLNGIALSGDINSDGEIFTLSPNSLPYSISRSGLNLSASSTLIFQSGVVVKPEAHLGISGSLIIDGQNPNDIVFTSLYDDSAGGDADNDGGIRTISKGDWPGIFLRPGSYSEIKGATFKYATAALNYQNSPINLSSAKFINNTIAISADSDSVVQNAATTTLEFIGNTTDVSPADLW